MRPLSVAAMAHALHSKETVAMTAPAPSTTEADDTSTATGEDALGDPGKAALTAIRKEKAAAEKQARDLAAELQALRDKDATASEVATRKAAEAEARATAAEQKLARIDAARDAKLPAEWVDRISGATYDEMFADAKALVKLIPAATTAPVTVPAGGKPREALQPGSNPDGALPLNGDPLVDSLKAKLGIA